MITIEDIVKKFDISLSGQLKILSDLEVDDKFLDGEIESKGMNHLITAKDKDELIFDCTLKEHFIIIMDYLGEDMYSGTSYSPDGSTGIIN